MWSTYTESGLGSAFALAMKIRQTTSLVALISAFALGACSGSSDQPSTAPTSESGPGAQSSAVGDVRIPFTPANDVELIDFLVPHHQMAIAMAAMEVERGASSELKQMAQQMMDAQRAEIAEMKTARQALTGGAEVPAPPADTHADADMKAMQGMSGAMLDQAFLAEMIAHHAAALSPVERAMPHLARDDMKALARKVFDTQAREIGEMNAMRTGLPDESPVGGMTSLTQDRRVPFTPGNDVAFIDFFVPHHRMALEMAKIEVAQGGRADVKAMAQKMIEDQTKEIDRMLAARAAVVGSSDVPAPPSDAVSEANLAAMRASSGAALDAMFLEKMSAHHAAALPSSLRARAFLVNADMIALAAKIYDAQATQIGQMTSIREQLAASNSPSH